MANSFKYTDWLGQEALRRLTNKTIVTNYFNSSFSKEFNGKVAVGASIRVPFPQRFIAVDGLGYVPQPIDMRQTTVNCDQIVQVGFEWDSVEKALKMPRPEEYMRENIINPAMDEMAQQIDSRAALFAYQNTNNIVGVLGTNPTSMVTIAQIRERQIQLAAGTGKKVLLIPPAVNTSLVDATKTSFNPMDAISEQYKDGKIGRAQGMDWFESMSLYSHTAGTSTTPTVNTAPVQGDTSIVLNCTSGDTFKQGDVYAFDSCKPVNPATRRTYGSSLNKQFVVTQDVTATGATVTVNLYPAFEGPGSQYQNIDAFPLAGAAATLFPGTSNPNGLSGMQGLALQKDAFAIVGVKLEEPESAEVCSQKRDPDSGIYVRVTRSWDPIQSRMINRFDACFGFGVLYADNCAVRLQSA